MGIHNSPQGCPCEPFLILKKRSISEFVFRSLEAPIHRTALRRLALSGLWKGLFLSVCFGFQASKFLSGIFLAWLLHGAFGDAINQELSEAFSAKPSPSAQKQYGLQIAERRGKILGELSIAGPILTTIAQMTDTETVMNLLRQVPLFANLKDEDKVCIEETEEWRLPAGEILVKAGEARGAFLCAP